MAITISGTPAAVLGTSVTLPTHNVGDVIVIFSYRNGSTTPPTIPSAGGTVPTWVVIDNPTGTQSNSADCCYAIAAANNHTSGTWTNATSMSVIVLSGASNTNPVGGHAQATALSFGTVDTPAVTLTKSDGSSAIINFFGIASNTAWSAAPSGYTTRASVTGTGGALVDTKDTTTSDGAVSQSYSGTGGGDCGQQVEILAATASGPTFIPVVIANRFVGPQALRYLKKQPAAPVAPSPEDIIAVSIAGSSTVTALVGAIRPLTIASVGGLTTVSLILLNLKDIPVATVNGSSTVTVSVTGVRNIIPATVNGSSTVTVSVTANRTISASVSSATVVTAQINADRLIAPASIQGSSTVTASFVSDKIIVVQVNGLTTVSNNVVATKLVAPVVNGSTTFTVALTNITGITPVNQSTIGVMLMPASLNGPIALHATGTTTGVNTSGTAILPEMGMAVIAQFVIEAVGATPTITFNFQGSLDNTNWYDMAYITDSSNTMATTALVKTAVGPYVCFLDSAGSRQYKFFRCKIAANTNVTYRSEMYALTT